MTTKLETLEAALRNALGETVQIGVPAGADVVYVERVEGMRALRYHSDNSRRGPVHRSSAGKVLAAFDQNVKQADEVSRRREQAGGRGRVDVSDE